MRILAISRYLPNPNHSSGELRFFSILSLLGKNHRVTLVSDPWAATESGQNDSVEHEIPFETTDFALHRGTIESALHATAPELVIFEFYYMAEQFITKARLIAPQALMAIDSVDIHFNRLKAKSSLTNSSEDRLQATVMEQRELAAYASADLVVVVSEDDRRILRSHLPTCPLALLPNVHKMQRRVPRDERQFGRLIFVGGFRHEPNVDAVQYFVTKVLPLIRARKPDVSLNIIGSHPSEEVLRLTGEGVTIQGFVPDTAPYLNSAYISIAPLRYGGGMKGKVGEALSHGLPVVTTKYGVEGFGVEAGKHLLVADTHESFADAVIRLLDDDELYCRLSEEGYAFIAAHYSTTAMSGYLDDFVKIVSSVRPKRLPASIRWRHALTTFYEKHVEWRLNA